MIAGTHRVRMVGLFVGIALSLSACVTATNQSIDKFTRGTDGLKVLLMPLDIELAELSAGGALEPKADWTEAAKTHVRAAIEKTMATRKARLVTYTPPAENTPSARDQLQLVKLHGAVGQVILASSLGLPLPNKEGKFDWTLGPDVRALRGTGDADYALFVYVRDSYASGGRAAVIAIGMLLGVGIPGGRQLGFASLVDLRSGEIVWFNRLIRGESDLRTAAYADASVELLLANLPK